MNITTDTTDTKDKVVAIIAAAVFAALRFAFTIAIYRYSFGFTFLQAVGIAFLPALLLERKVDWTSTK